jgi:ferric-dicitrate binding protein FerR (iron transport regulator)
MSIVKSLRNIISSQEEHKIDAWLQDYNDNSEVLNEIITEEADFSFLKDYQQFDTPAAWNSIESQIQEDTKPVTKQFSLILKVAAVGAVLLFSLFAIKPMLTGDAISGMETMAYADKGQLNLPDGSLLLVDKGSSVEYNKDAFNDNRMLAFEGRAYFDIAKSKEGKNFVIESEDLTVEILGTEFEINTIADQPSVIVTEGKVKVTTATESMILVANESVHIENGKIVKDTHSSPNIKSWFTGEIAFESVTMDKVIEDLENHFNKPIVTNDVDLSCTWRAKFTNDSLEEVLNELSETRGAAYTITDKEITISNISCN